jgi:glucose-1-phosphate cytidylyltransferase
MRYYSHYGHRDFVLCLGYRGDLIREYFLSYSECRSNDFTLTLGTGEVELHSSDVRDWRITFVDTGLHANIGQRLLQARRFVKDEPYFLANYSDCLADVPLDRMIMEFEQSKVTALFAAVSNPHTVHTVRADSTGRVTEISRMQDSGLLINGGFFVLRADIFDYIGEGDELVEQPFARLIEKSLLSVHQHQGFWQPMDTFKDKIMLDRMEAQGNCPWMVWRTRGR